MIRIFNTLAQKAGRLSDVSLLIFRLLLSYGFYTPAMNKIRNIEAIAGWFAEMNFVFPKVNAYLAATTEFSGFILLFLGLGTRLIAIPLMFVMIVAITTVHLGNGFEAGNNGFEIPLYYLAMLFSLVVYGPGKFSLDQLIKKRLQK